VRPRTAEWDSTVAHDQKSLRKAHSILKFIVFRFDFLRVCPNFAHVAGFIRPQVSAWQILVYQPKLKDIAWGAARKQCDIPN
jgi:hypothetical protein